MNDKCPVCGYGNLTHHTYENEVEYRACFQRLKTCFSTCDYCLSEITDEKQSKFNKALMIEFRNYVDSILDYDSQNCIDGSGI